jgi:hypothetical protein
MKTVNRNHMTTRLLFGLVVLATLALPGLSLAAYEQVDPIAHWKLEESAANYLDQTSNNYDLNCSGPCPVQIASPDAVVGNGQRFGLSGGSYRALRVLPGIDTTDTLYDWANDASFSFEVWFRRNSTTAFNDSVEVFLGRYEGNNLQWWVGMRGGSNLGKIGALLKADNGEGAGTMISSTKTYNDAQWHHAAVVRDGAAGTTYLYVDGELQGTHDIVFTSGASFSGDEELHIGELNGGDYFEFQGALDEVAIYNAALTAQTVYGHYAAGLNGRGYDEDFDPVIEDLTTAATGYVGYAYDLKVLAAGNPSPDTYTLTTAPDDMEISSAGAITWTPNSLQTGNNDVTVEASVSASGASASDDFVIPVEDVCDSTTTSYWKLEETAAPFADYTLNALEGSCTSCPSTTTGQVGEALAFDGSANNFVQFDAAAGAASSIDIPLATSFSVAAWVNRADGISSTEVVIGRNAASGMQLWLGIEGGDNAAFSLRDDTGTGRVQVSGSADIADGDWHLIVGAYDAAVGEMRIYVDGVQDGSAVSAAFTAGFTSDSAPLLLGNLSIGGGFDFTGAIDEVAIFKFIPSTDMMTQMMTLPKGYCQAAPTIDTTAPTSVDEGATYTYQPTASDADDTAFTWSLANNPTDMSIDVATGVVSWTPAAGTTTSGAVTLIVDDGEGGRAIETFTVTVNASTTTNQAPVITGQVSDPISMTEDTPLEITIAHLVANDPDNGPAALQLGTVADGDNYTVSGFTITPASGYTGDLTVPVTVTDGADTSSAFDLNVSVNAVSAALDILSTAGTSVNAGETYTYTPSTSRPQATLAWSLSGAPSGMDVNASTGVVTWTPADGVTTSGEVTLTVTDAADNTSDSETFTITVSNGGTGTGGGGGGGGGGCFIASVGNGSSSLGLLSFGLLGSLMALLPRR